MSDNKKTTITYYVANAYLDDDGNILRIERDPNGEEGDFDEKMKELEFAAGIREEWQCSDLCVQLRCRVWEHDPDKHYSTGEMTYDQVEKVSCDEKWERKRWE